MTHEQNQATQDQRYTTAGSQPLTRRKDVLSATELLDEVLDNVISYDMLLILTKRGDIPSFPLGKRRFYRREVVEDWMREQEEISHVGTIFTNKQEVHLQ